MPPTKKLQQSVIVSWYKHGRVTANGERFNPNGLTVAHKSLPFGTKVRFTNPNTGSSVVLRVNDRGPFIKGRQFDLTLRAAKILGFVDEGVSKLNVEIFNR
jgi:rare lipoprotein A